MKKIKIKFIYFKEKLTHGKVLAQNLLLNKAMKFKEGKQNDFRHIII